MHALSLLSSENKINAINALIPTITHIDKTTEAVKSQVNQFSKENPNLTAGIKAILPLVSIPVADKLGLFKNKKPIEFNPNLKDHLSNVESFSQKKGVTGGHNSVAFHEAVKEHNLLDIKTIPSETPGISNVEYLIPKQNKLFEHIYRKDSKGEYLLDRQGNRIMEYKEKSKTKTVYKPDIFSDKKMLELAKRAGIEGYERAMKSPKGQINHIIHGISFRVYVDKKKGVITNVHPN